jgi:hypothetical protein
MKNYLIAPLLFLFNFIRINKVKSIAIGLLFIIAPVLNSLEDVKRTHDIYKEIKLEGYKYSYVTTEINDSKIEYDIESFNKKPKIIGQKIITYHYNDANILIWILFITCFLFVIVPIFTNDDDIEYEMDLVYSVTLSYFVSCDFIDNQYVYHTDKKIIGKSNRQINDSNISRYYDIVSPTNFNNCPEYMSLQRARQNKLNKLGI